VFPGNEVVLAHGHRYAPDQFEATAPRDLGTCRRVATDGIAARMVATDGIAARVVATDGIAARVVAKRGRMKAATQVSPLGLIGDRTGQVLNVAVPTFSGCVR